MKRFTAAAAAAVLLPSLALADHGAMHHATTFKVRVENVSTPRTLQLSTGSTAPAPTSPVIWLTHTGAAPLFKTGTKDRGQGLEGLSEDGDPGRLAQSCKGAKGVSAVGVMNVPVGDSQPGPALPGKAFEFTFTANPGERLTVAMMFGQSNDLFYAPDEKGIALWDKAGRPVSGDLTSQFVLWDAGTEVNQEPGVGTEQGPRQKGPNTGADEHGKVGLVKDGFTYPRVSEVIKVTITPDAMAAK